jgi:hypothetical protein
VRGTFDGGIGGGYGHWSPIYGPEPEYRSVATNRSLYLSKVLPKHEASDLAERARVEQKLDPLVGSQLASLVLATNAILPRRAEGQQSLVLKLRERPPLLFRGQDGH